MKKVYLVCQFRPDRPGWWGPVRQHDSKADAEDQAEYLRAVLGPRWVVRVEERPR